MTSEAAERRLCISGWDRWLPVDLAADPDDHRVALAEQFRGSAAVDVVDYYAAIVVGAAAAARRSDAADPTSTLVALWAYLVSGGNKLESAAFATLRAVAVGPVSDPEAVFHALGVNGHDLGDPAIAKIETGSGPATRARWRVAAIAGDVREVHEMIGVLWLRPADHVAYLLSVQVADLALAERLTAAVTDLASGTAGL
ncbi:hypothetical protein F0U44_05635 [Nocardioides humilatus]|uniref:Uncharacterized protein n=1 Tax=Nocardioides humilatus TaxID=2607660 RepID=A0A5B1LM45_9ACTN|nr:hypothetical protein [Nocardioides humilatus]KAA1421752.1 hypothetical protein F0U44_05635 [Nocardioides humilatus]